MELVHPVDSRSIVLWRHFQSAIRADRASRAASQVLGVSTLEMLGSEVFRRHAQDQERPLGDLIGERRVPSDFALAGGPPRGITLDENDAEILVRLSRKYAMRITDTDVCFVRPGTCERTEIGPIPLAEIRHVAAWRRVNIATHWVIRKPGWLD